MLPSREKHSAVKFDFKLNNAFVSFVGSLSNTSETLRAKLFCKLLLTSVDFRLRKYKSKSQALVRVHPSPLERDRKMDEIRIAFKFFDLRDFFQ